MDSTDNLVVLMTCGKMEEAEKIAQALVEEGLAACVNLMPGITSIYRWDEKLCQEPEVLMIAKTRPDRLEAFEARVKALHSYTVPEILALPLRAGSKDYLKWVGEVCG